MLSEYAQILSKSPPAATKPPLTRNVSIAPCCSIGATPAPLVLMPPLISISRAEPGLDAQADRGEANDDSLDQRLAGAPKRLDTATHDESAYGLADLNADGPISVSGHAVEFGKVYGSTGVNIEAPCALAEGFDWCIYFQLVHDPEVHKADAARTVRGDLLLLCWRLS